MKKKILVGAVLAGMLSMGNAFAAALTTAQITAVYNGDASNIFGSDFLQSLSSVSNVTGLAAYEGPEFITGDSLIQVDFNSTGLVTFTLDGVANDSTSLFTFDFGNSLASNISGFSAVDVSQIISGAPVLSVINGHQITADLSSVTGGASGYTFTSQLAFAAAVPEPMTSAMLLAGLGIVGFVSRKRIQK